MVWRERGSTAHPACGQAGRQHAEQAARKSPAVGSAHIDGDVQPSVRGALQAGAQQAAELGRLPLVHRHGCDIVGWWVGACVCVGCVLDDACVCRAVARELIGLRARLRRRLHQSLSSRLSLPLGPGGS